VGAPRRRFAGFVERWWLGIEGKGEERDGNASGHERRRSR
jgi:hypothetical protein